MKTTGKELIKWKNRDIKLPIHIPIDVMRPVWVNSQMLVTEEGCVVRDFALMTVKRWKDVDELKREDLLKELRVWISVHCTQCYTLFY